MLLSSPLPENLLAMKAVQFLSKDLPLEVNEVPTPVPAEGEVLIRLAFAAFNHLDLWIWQEKVLEKPVISGADGSGVVESVGRGVDKSLFGKEVIINPGLYWGDDERFTGKNFQILGNPTNGTFAEYITIPREYVHEKPAHLNLEEAAALPLAALTAYRALFSRADLQPSDKVLITGIGGGAALYLLQIANAAGASVYVTSSSEEKIRRAIAMGAKGGYNYRDAAWVTNSKDEIGGFDVIIDSAGGDGFAALADVANPGARIVNFGRTAGNINGLKPWLVYNKQLQILGTMMGTPAEFKAMLEFYSKHKLRPTIDKTFLLDEVNAARDYMNSGDHFGKIMLQVGDK